MADTQKSKGRRMFTLPVFAAVVLLMALALLLIPRGKKTGSLSPGDSLTIPLASVTQTASFYPVNVDGARLAYALSCPENDVSLADLAELCDAFYIGGTKCGALFGEAVVVPEPKRIPHLFTIIKQHGALLAKGRLLGIQFDELFRDDLYLKIGEPAVRVAADIRKTLKEKGYRLFFESPTNQIFVVIENEAMKKLGERVEYGFWEKYDDDHTVIRLAADWGTTEAEIAALSGIL